MSGEVPVGSVVAFAGEVLDTGNVVEVRPGWLLCNGAALRDSAFPELFKAIQACHGNGMDSPTPPASFNLPDYRGYFLRGVSGNSGRDPNNSDAHRPQNHPGGNVGNRVGSVQADQVGSHSHAIFGRHLEAEGGHGFDGAGFDSNSSHGSPFEHDYSTKASDGTETRPRNAYVFWIIRAK
jgi:hypothetical protein